VTKKEARVQVTWVKSSIGYPERQKGTIRALGLKALGDRVVHKDTAVIRGMIDKVSHLVQVERL
jgi:large subunit ribosomal protein L30